jgi:hypothetical protein
LQSLGDCERAKGNGKRISGAAIVLLLAVSMLAAGGSGTGTHVETVTFEPGALQFGRLDGYDTVSLEGARWLCRPGEPRLPALPYRIALPPDSRVVSVAISVEDSLILGGEFHISPARAPRPLSVAAPDRYAPAEDSVYLMREFYPASFGEYVGAGRMDGVPICDVMLYPLRYSPAESKLMLATGLRIEVEYAAGWPRTDGSAVPDARMIEGLVSGSAPHAAEYKKKLLDLPYATLAETEVAYLVIADSSLAASFEPLIEWKMKKGVTAALVTLDEIEAAYAGADVQERIRNCIGDYNSTRGTVWVLLGGDTEFIPERRLYVGLSDKPYIPADLYYADLDGTWNDDGDLRWGEVPADGVDMYADVYLGRAPVSTPAEVDVFVDKVLTYEGAYGPPGDHLKHMMFAAEILWGDLGDPSDPEYTDGGGSKDIIEASCVPGGFTVEKLYESLYNLSQDAVVTALNEGRGMVNVNCHGEVTGISLGDESLPVSSVMNLTCGSAYGLLYATSCMVGAYEQNSIGEAWVRSPAGGGFFIGNSRYGWGVPGAPGQGPSDHYDQSFFETVFIMGLNSLGKAHAYAKHEYVAESRYDDYYRYVMYGLNLFGDPETPLWTDQPAELTVQFPAVLPVGVCEFPVTVTSGGAPATGAKVCLYKPGDVHVVGDTDALGTMTFYIEPAETGTLYVTASGGNYLPYVGSSTVEEADTGVPAGPGRLALSLTAEPNPFTSKVSFAVTGSPGSRVEIGVFDVRGRRVTGFELQASESGAAAVVWEGRDSEGRKVSPGIYIVRADAESAAVSRKVLVLR